MNKQNELIVNQMDAAAAALATLNDLHITVLSIRMGEQSQPVIEVQHSRACTRLESGIYMIVNRGCVRLHERVAIVRGCRVRWLQRAA
jgi:hypothetical protein